MTNNKVLVEEVLLKELLDIAKENQSAISKIQTDVVDTYNKLLDVEDTVNEAKITICDVANKLGV